MFYYTRHKFILSSKDGFCLCANKIYIYVYLQFELIFSVAVYKSLGLGPKEKHEATNFGFAKVTNTLGNTFSRIEKINLIHQIHGGHF